MALSITEALLAAPAHPRLAGSAVAARVGICRRHCRAIAIAKGFSTPRRPVATEASGSSLPVSTLGGVTVWHPSYESLNRRLRADNCDIL